MLEIGSVLEGKYKILNVVGHGGTSVVYLAMNERANKQWAVKETRKDCVMNYEAVTEILKSLNHPNLPRIVDVIDTSDSFVIVMDYIGGKTLSIVLAERNGHPQDEKVVADWALQLCDVLRYLHTQNPPIYCRELKATNVMLTENDDDFPYGKVTLIDYGIFSEKRGEFGCGDVYGAPMPFDGGTSGYAAPEQLNGTGQIDARTDIYALGATLYHLVTGVRPEPLNVKSIREINPGLSAGLEWIILKCTQLNPDDRFQTAEEVLYALEENTISLYAAPPRGVFKRIKAAFGAKKMEREIEKLRRKPYPSNHKSK